MNAILCRLSVGCVLLIAPAVMLVAAETEGGWSVDGSILNVESMGTVSGFTLDGEESGISLGLGYDFTKHIGVRAKYHIWGEHFATDCPPPLLCIVTNLDQIDISGLSMSVVGAWPITRELQVYGKLGVVRWDADFAQFQRDDSGRDALYGVGIGVSLSPNWRLNLEYEEVNGLDLEYAGLGLMYRF